MMEIGKAKMETGTQASQRPEDATRALEELAIIERVARIVSSVRGTKPDYTRLATELEQAIPFDVFGVALLRHDRQAVRVTACHCEGSLNERRWAASHHQHPLDEAQLQQLLHMVQLVTQDYPHGINGPPATSGYALSHYHYLHSTVIAPLIVEDRMLGVLELGSCVLNMYADATLQRLVGAVARVLAAAIESAQVGGSAEIQNRQRQALKHVSHALAAKMDLSSILNHIVVGIAEALNVASAIVTLNRREGKLQLEAQSGLDHPALSAIFNTPLPLDNASIVGHALLHRQPVVSHDIAGDSRFPLSRPLYTELGLRSIYSYPLIIGNTIYGVLLLCSAEAGGFTPLKGDILSLFASQATIAIHNGLLLSAAQQRNQFQQMIEQLEQVMESTSSTEGRGEGYLPQHADAEELALLAHVRRETQRTFGISFTTLLRIISEHLLTTNERDLVSRGQNSEKPAVHRLTSTEVAHVSDPDVSVSDTLSLLTRTAEDALERVVKLGELSGLLTQLKQAANSIDDPWFIIDLNGTCIYMNPAAESFCGIRMEDIGIATNGPLIVQQGIVSPTSDSEETVLGATFGGLITLFTHLLPRARNAEELRLFLQDFTQGIVYRQQLRCTFALEPLPPVNTLQEGQLKEEYIGLHLESAPSDNHYQFARYPLRNKQGRLIANALHIRNITERVHDEKNKSALLSSVSHDLRTPLTAIKAAVTGLLQSDILWEEHDRQMMLEEIDAEVDHLTVLVNAIIEMSRINMGALLLEKEWCDIVEILYGSLAKAHRVLAGRPVRTHLQPDLPLVYADHVQLERVFYNLLENAARYSLLLEEQETSERAEISVIIDTVDDTASSSELAGTTWLRVRVIDHGPGVPPRERERIFKSFYALRSYGNGLGLAICKGIIDAHQGRIWVEAAGGHEGDALTGGQADHISSSGSCFIFMLPTHPYLGGGLPVHIENHEVGENPHPLLVPPLEELP